MYSNIQLLPKHRASLLNIFQLSATVVFYNMENYTKISINNSFIIKL